MSSHDQESFIDRIDETKSFFNNWSPLRDAKGLHIPVGWDAERAVTKGDTDGLRDFLDRPGVEAQPAYRVQLVYTDPSRADEKASLMAEDSFLVLHRTFRAGSCNGILFNHLENSPSGYQAYTMHRFAVPRLCGLLKTDAPELEWEQHLTQATAAMQANDIYAAFYHSAEAREMGAGIHRCFPLEFDALLSLGLYEQAQSFFDWFRSQCKKREMLELPRARLLTTMGQPREALAIIKPLLVKSGNNPELWLERGRALFRQDRVSDAIKSFEQCLRRDPKNVDATLGLGIAIRAMHYESSDRDGLQEAASHLEKVLESGDYYRPESAHHLGTIYLALEEYEKAERYFKQAIALAPSSVSRKNLALVQHALDKKDMGILQAQYLMTHYPDAARGLERYYPELTSGARTIVVKTESFTGQSSDTNSSTGDSYSREEQSEQAFAALKRLGLCLQGDLMDFRRFDDYVNYYAPCGSFLRSSSLAALNVEEVNLRLLDCARHFAAVLVRGNHARYAAQQSPHATEVEFLEGPSTGITLDLLPSVLRRLQAGSVSDNLTNLDFMVSGFSPYRTLSEQYSNPFVTLEMEDERIFQLKARGGRALASMKSLGFPMNGDTNDLRQMDLAINSFFDESSELRKAAREKSFTDSSIEDLGIYLGFLIQKLAGGVWYDHPDVQGIALRELDIQDIYPVARVTKLFIAGRPSDAVTCLSGLEAPLALARLSRQVREHEITTRTQLREALEAAVPSIMLDDPSGAALNRMTEMVVAMSNVPLPR